ncbi:MAG TPA: hypothetical protein VHY56_04535 [Candidatus Binataceae bacterium]|nr:hypothetical protein [Candidatus Binataceae bacterium]
MASITRADQSNSISSSSTPQQADPRAEAADLLEHLARNRFGDLSAAELRLVRHAPYRELAWSGPSDDPDNPLNDPAHGKSWGADRTIRAPIIVWLMTAKDASAQVDPSGIGVAGALIHGSLDLSYNETTLPLTMLSCAIPDGVEFSFAQVQEIDLRRSWTGPIDGEQATIRGDVTLRLGSYGDVSLFRSEVGGTVDLSSAHLIGADPFSAVEAIIHGDVLFHEGFTTAGMIDLRLAHIGQGVSFNHAIFTGQGDNGLNAERARIDGAIYWVAITTGPHTQLDLADAHAGSLWDDAASWPTAGNLYVNGFVYGDFSGGPADAAQRLEWLHRQPVTLWAQPQPYRQLAQVLSQEGAEEGVIQVRIAKENAMTQYGHLTMPDRLWHFILRITIGYGYRPLRALWWIMLFVVIGAVFFGWGYRARLITPTEASAYQVFVRTGNPPLHYPSFNAFVYSLENFMPVVDLHQGIYWRPNPLHARHGERATLPGGLPNNSTMTMGGETAATMLRWYLWLHILAGWTITPLLFAGLAGLLRND